jgi:arabinogalactan endo-1,4-beta-galactosidase
MTLQQRTARRALALLATAALAAAPMTAAADTRTPSTGTAADTVTLVNPGFEDGLSGWDSSSAGAGPTAGAAGTTNAAPYGGSGHLLRHRSDGSGVITTSQGVTGLGPGWWTVRATVRSGGAPSATALTLTCGGQVASSTVPLTGDAAVQLATSAVVTKPRARSVRGGDCTVTLVTDGPARSWATMDDVVLERGRVTRDIRGGDLSGVAKNEDFGAVYRDTDGTAADPVDLLADQGMNLARLKVWVDPADGFNETTHVVSTARRAEAAGMDVMIDFHYSDRWTDPGAQGVPSAWADASPGEMAGLLADHTREVLAALRDADVTVDYVQTGNEINPGMLWPHGQTWDVDPDDGVPGAQWDNLAAFLTAGHDAVKEVFPGAQSILHLTNINAGIGSLTWWFDEITARDVPFDLIGLSYYGYWHGTLADLQNAVETLSSRYDRDVMVVETAYPFTLDDDEPNHVNVIASEDDLGPGYPATEEGQAAAYRAVQDVVASADGGRGLGTVYWEPAWTAVAGSGWDPADPTSGNAWENQAMFGFDDRLLPLVAAELAPDPGPRP